MKPSNETKMESKAFVPLRFAVVTGSERAGGNTDQMARYIDRLLAQHQCVTDVISLRDYRITACGSCGQCNTRAHACQIDDDMPAIVDRLVRADAIIYAAPVHGYGMAHPMQVFIERAGVGYLRFERPLANKVAGAVVTGRRYAHEAVYHQLISNLLLNRMILVGSGYPVVIHGGAPGSALQDTEGLACLAALVSRMVGMTRLLDATPAALRSALLHPETMNERAV